MSNKRELSNKLYINGTDYTSKLRPSSITISKRLDLDIFGQEITEFKCTLEGYNLNEEVSTKGNSVVYHIIENGVDFIVFNGNISTQTSKPLNIVNIEAHTQLNSLLGNKKNTELHSLGLTDIKTIINTLTLFLYAPPGSGSEPIPLFENIDTMNTLAVAHTVGSLSGSLSILEERKKNVYETIKPYLYPHLACLVYDNNTDKAYCRGFDTYYEEDYVHIFNLADYKALSVENVKLSTSEYPSVISVTGYTYLLVGDDSNTTIFSGKITGKEIKANSSLDIALEEEYLMNGSNYLNPKATYRESDDDTSTIISVNIDTTVIDYSPLTLRVQNNNSFSVFLNYLEVETAYISGTGGLIYIYKKNSTIEGVKTYDTEDNAKLELTSMGIQSSNTVNQMLAFLTILRNTQIKFEARAKIGLKLADKIRLELQKDVYIDIIITQIEEDISFTGGYNATYKGIICKNDLLDNYMRWTNDNTKGQWQLHKWL